MARTKTRKITIEIEIPEGVELEELLRGVRYRIIDRRMELDDILRRARRKGVRIARIPTREEIYGERAGH